MKISILTVAFNSANTIRDTIESVLSQDYPQIEYIIVDGNSQDGTQQIIQSYGNRITKWISEPDKGIYDAMNKAVCLATGDIVGILNSDDFYPDKHVLSRVANVFESKNVDSVFGDLRVIDPIDLSKTVRKLSPSHWVPAQFARGFMPPHPTFFVRRKYYEKYGLFKTDYKIASDYELLIRFLYVHRLSYYYLPETLVIMRKGGVSSSGVMSNIILNNEILRACNENGIKTNLGLIYLKYFVKIFELF